MSKKPNSKSNSQLKFAYIATFVVAAVLVGVISSHDQTYSPLPSMPTLIATGGVLLLGGLATASATLRASRKNIFSVFSYGVALALIGFLITILLRSMLLIK